MAAVDPAERLLNLIIALTHARVRMTRADIRENVYGYDAAVSGLSPEDTARRLAAFERMFERDKEDIRRMGIPLQTVVDPAHGDEIGYRIDPSNSAMAPIDLTAAELAVVALAQEFWSDATVGAEARQALTKVASGAGPRPQVVLPLAAKSAASSAAFVVLADAIHRKQAVSFEYSSATQSGESVRTVEPWQLQVGSGAQYVVGFDRDRDAPRTFRLSRILGAVKPTGPEGAFAIPKPMPKWDSVGQAPLKTATVAIRPESGHSLRERGVLVRNDAGWDVVEVPYRHADSLRDDVLALAGNAVIVEPLEVAQEVLDYARAAIEVTSG